jgi:uncharacterized protein (DUF433 family)
MTPLAITNELKPSRGDLESGFYALKDLRAFVAFDGNSTDAARVPQWLRAVLNPVDRRPHHPDYSFGDLISLFVVRELVRKGVAPHTIHEAEIWLRRKWRTERPFMSGEIQTDGRGIFVDDDLIAGQIESADLHGQQVLRELVRERLTKVGYHEGVAAYWTPVDGVLVDPRVQFGEPVLSGTRLTTSLISAAARELGAARTASRYRIAADDVERALRFEQQLESAG